MVARRSFGFHGYLMHLPRTWCTNFLQIPKREDVLAEWEGGLGRIFFLYSGCGFFVSCAQW